jgi:hypothetical protein
LLRRAVEEHRRWALHSTFLFIREVRILLITGAQKFVVLSLHIICPDHRYNHHQDGGTGQESVGSAEVIMGKLSIRSRRLLLFCGIVLLVGLTAIAALKKRRIELEIGSETTFIAGPRFPDGQVDYLLALHEKFSEGVNPDDNAAILIDRAFGPHAISPELRKQYFEWMNAEPLSDKGEYAASQELFLRQSTRAADATTDQLHGMWSQFEQAERPWTEAELPLAAEWLDRNAKPLEIIVRAADRTQYYVPSVTRVPFCSGTMQNLIDVSRLLVVRAMLRLRRDDVDGAWSDLLTCHRLARLASQRAATSTQFLNAARMDAIAARGDASLLAHKLTIEQINRFASDFSSLPPFARLADTAIYGDRFEFLDTILLLRESADNWDDVNLLLRSVNAYFDLRSAQLRNKATGADQASKDATLKEAKKRVEGLQGKGTIFDPRYESWTTLLSAGHGQTALAEARRDTRCNLLRLGFALAKHRAERGELPQSLEELTGSDLKTVPLDSFTNTKFRYLAFQDGFLIYSVGPNGEDNGGQNRPGPGHRDDVAFEVFPPMDATLDPFEKAVRSVISDILRVASVLIPMDQPLSDPPLRADALDLDAILIELEDRLNIRSPDSTLEKHRRQLGIEPPKITPNQLIEIVRDAEKVKPVIR